MEHLIRIEHIGIAVKNLASAEALYTKLLGAEPYKREAVESEGVITSFFKTGPNKIELLESTRPDGPIAKAIEKRGEGIHHIAFEVADIRAEMARLKAEGFTLLSEEPKPGADNKLVCFIHPKSAGGVLVELCQERGQVASGE
jgi:methylmalonyl-CoA/ethylmalonyl-CoA epimerase